MLMVRSAQSFGMRAFKYALPTSLTMTRLISIAAIYTMVELKCYLRHTIAQIATEKNIILSDVGTPYLNARIPNHRAERTTSMSIDPHTAAIIIQQDTSCREYSQHMIGWWLYLPQLRAASIARE